MDKLLMSDTSVSKILKYFKAKYPQRGGGNRTWVHNPQRSDRMHPSLWQRRLKMLRDSRYHRVENYKYHRIKGMVIHESLRLFKEQFLPFLHLRIGDQYRPTLFWYNMRFKAYECIIECCDNMNAGDFPQIDFYYEKLVCDALECLESHLSNLYNQIIPRLERNQKLRDIIEGYMEFLQEENHFVNISGLTIYFQPDWLQINPEVMYLTDFKSGEFKINSSFFKSDRRQVLLYAYLLEICYFPKKIASITLHYLGDNKTWKTNFTDILREEAWNDIREYSLDKMNLKLSKIGLLKTLRQSAELEEEEEITTSLDKYIS